MATAKNSTAKKALNSVDSVVSDASKIAQDGIDRVKDAVPNIEGVASDVKDYVQEHTNVDLQRFADDATTFVRRNPGTSLAAAAGIGVLIGILATRRS